MTERLLELLGGFPFLLLAQKGSGGRIRFNTSRIIEAVIIGVITGLVSGYIMMQRMDVKVTYLEREMDTIQSDMKHHIEWDTHSGPGR